MGGWAVGGVVGFVYVYVLACERIGHTRRLLLGQRISVYKATDDYSRFSWSSSPVSSMLFSV